MALLALVTLHCASSDRLDRDGVWEEAEALETRVAPPAVHGGAPPTFTDPNASGDWRPIGPARIATPLAGVGVANGRVNAVAVSPADERVILMGADGGGIWRSEDGGASFRLATETDGGVPAIEFSPVDPAVAYAMADGEMTIGTPGSLYDGAFLRSTDGGKTWSRMHLPYRGSSFPGTPDPRIRPDARERDRVLITTFGAVWSSPDGGWSWSQVLECAFCDTAYFASNPSVWLLHRFFPSDTSPAGVYRSADGGRTWSHAFSGPFDAGSSYRAVLGVSPSSGTAYWCANSRLFVTRDEGTTWTEQAKASRPGAVYPMPPNGCPAYIGVSPVSPESLFFGYSQNTLFLSTDAGMTFTAIGELDPALRSPLHIDNRGFALTRTASYFGTDGGLYKGDSGAGNVSARNQGVGSLVQFYSIAASPLDPAVVVGGTQDNGLLLGDLTRGRWRYRTGGDVGPIVFDVNDPTRILWSVSVTGFALLRTTGLTQSGSVQSTQTVATVPMLEPDGSRTYRGWSSSALPLASARRGTVYTGTWRLYASNDFGTTWTRTSELDLTHGASEGDMIAIIAVAVDNDDAIYTVSGGSRVMRSADGGTTWTDVSGGLPSHGLPEVTALAALRDGMTAIAGLNTRHSAMQTILRTTDGGATWTPVPGFPAVSVHALHSDRVEPDVVYAGTDAGVFRSPDGGVTWSFYGAGLPRSTVSALTRTADGRMIAATYGRGAYGFVAASTKRRATRH